MTDEPLNARNKNGITRQPGALYATFYADMREVAKTKGYALALHGSLTNDLDVVAVPWTDDPIPAEDLVAALAEITGAHVSSKIGEKPHGRRVWTLYLNGGSGYIDLSVMPTVAELTRFFAERPHTPEPPAPPTPNMGADLGPTWPLVAPKPEAAKADDPVAAVADAEALFDFGVVKGMHLRTIGGTRLVRRALAAGVEDMDWWASRRWLAAELTTMEQEGKDTAEVVRKSGVLDTPEMQAAIARARGDAPAAVPPGGEEGREEAQAGEWGGPSHWMVRSFPGYRGMTGYPAAWVRESGWTAFRDGRPFASGPETGDLGQCCSDLALCSRGHLSFDRIQWGPDDGDGIAALDRHDAVLHFLSTVPSADPVDFRLTPSTLDRVLAAVRATGQPSAPGIKPDGPDPDTEPG